MGPTYDFSGRLVVVTGGARGQGLSHAAAFAKFGARVIVWDTTRGSRKSIPYALSGPEDFRKATSMLQQFGSENEIWDVDVSCEDEVARAAARIQEMDEPLQVLVNNAGVNSIRSLAELDREAWMDVIEVNLLGTFWPIKHLAPIMAKNGGGRIINIASLAAFRGIEGQAHYVASKAAVIGLTRCLAMELGKWKIAVNAVCPSLVNSPMSRMLAQASSGSSALFGPLYALSGVSCLEEVDVTQCVLWLASEAARHITGGVQMVDAGSLL